MGKTFLTKRDFEKLQSELEIVKNVHLSNAKKDFQVAKGFGDPQMIQETKEKLNFYKQRVLDLQEILSTTELIEEDGKPNE